MSAAWECDPRVLGAEAALSLLDPLGGAGGSLGTEAATPAPVCSVRSSGSRRSPVSLLSGRYFVPKAL